MKSHEPTNTAFRIDINMTNGSPFLACLERAAKARKKSIDAAAAQSQNQEEENDATNSHNNEQISSTASDQLPHENVGNMPFRKCGTQHVWTISQRSTVVQWMINNASENGEKNICARAVKEFPSLFRSTPNANIKRAMRLWKGRDSFTFASTNKSNLLSITKNTRRGLKRVNLKAHKGRGRKRESWVEALHKDLREEFDRLRKLGVKFNHSTLRLLAMGLLKNSTNSEYASTMIDPRSGLSQAVRVDARWIQAFADRFQIVQRSKCGKPRLSPEKTVLLEKEIAAHLGRLKKGFQCGDLREEDISNADETHFVINMDNGKTLGVCGDQEVRYADVTSAGEGMTLVVRLSGGPAARIEPPLIIFMNKNRSYPIRGVMDNIPGVAYRTGPKGWMDSINMIEWLREPRVIRPLPNNRLRIMYIDNCSSHNMDEHVLDAAENIRTTLCYFPPNSTAYTQPCDSFVIQKIKDAWRRRWDEYKLSLIQSSKWTSAGKLPNPGKNFFLRLAADAVNDVNKQRDADGLSFARKAMIMCGLALNTSGVWEERQLKPELQNIINKHRHEFEHPDDGDDL